MVLADSFISFICIFFLHLMGTYLKKICFFTSEENYICRVYLFADFRWYILSFLDYETSCHCIKSTVTYDCPRRYNRAGKRYTHAAVRRLHPYAGRSLLEFSSRSALL